MNKNNDSIVSVVITCYNYSEYIAEAIESVLSQTYRDIKLIVIDDGSTDNSLEIINRYSDRARIVSRKNKGILYTRNEALELVDTKYICFLDADDYFDNDYIEKMVRVAERYSADIVYPNWRIFGEREDKTNFPEFDVKLLATQQIHCTVESLVRRDSIGSHKFESEEVAEDWDFFLGLALDGKKFKLASECHINYRVRGGTRGSSRSYWDDMRYFFAILQKWDERFPDIIQPIDLPIYIGKQRDARISQQDELLEERARMVHEKERQRAKAVEDLNNVINSRAFRLGKMITAPLKFLKKIL